MSDINTTPGTTHRETAMEMPAYGPKTLRGHLQEQEIPCDLTSRIYRFIRGEHQGEHTGIRTVTHLVDHEWGAILERTTSIASDALAIAVPNREITGALQRRAVEHDGNNELRAIIRSLHPGIDSYVEGVVSRMLRGDLVMHIKNNIQTYRGHFGDATMDPGHLNELVVAHCDRMIDDNVRIGAMELLAVSNLLKTPIHIHDNNKSEKIVGEEHRRSNREPIHLHLDYTTSFYDAMN